MKLADIKKLKVAELRSRLKEVGLDSKGLKAELVDRLWSAIELGQGHADEKILVKIKLDSSPKPVTPTDLVDDCVPSSTDAGLKARYCVDRTRELTNSATQTESDIGETTVQHGTELLSESVNCSVDERMDVDEAVFPEEEETGRGRAFYEFKEEIRYKRAKSSQPAVDRENTEKQDEDEVRLDPYDSHLHFEVSSDGFCGQPRFWAQSPSLWSGSRLSHGVLEGRVGFEVRLENTLLTTEPYGVRVGWSVADTSLLLGEEEVSFAYDGSSKKVSGGKEEEFGERFSVGDIIGCYASFSTDGGVQLSFHKNGRFMGVAFSLDASVLLRRPLFPHILCKSCSVRFLLDPTTPTWYPSPPGFTPLAALTAEQRIRSTLAPFSKAQCEVLMMVGLPGSGKSHWAQAHMKQHPQKHYRLLSTEELLACMISGGQRDGRLRQASQTLTALIKMAAQTPGNYILDQCNILFSARSHKLQLFAGFRRRVVVVFPSADEWQRRLSLHRTSDEEHIPQTALLKQKVSCSLPEQQTDLMEELQYVELPQEKAQALLQEYKERARRLLPPVSKQEKKHPRHHRKRNRPLGRPQSHMIPRTGINGWNHMSWKQHPRYWNVAYQDQSYNYNRDYGCYGNYC